MGTVISYSLCAWQITSFEDRHLCQYTWLSLPKMLFKTYIASCDGLMFSVQYSLLCLIKGMQYKVSFRYYQLTKHLLFCFKQYLPCFHFLYFFLSILSDSFFINMCLKYTPKCTLGKKKNKKTTKKPPTKTLTTYYGKNFAINQVCIQSFS